MKERLKAGVLKDSAKNKDVNGGASVRDIKEEVKEVKGQGSTLEVKAPVSTPEVKPPTGSSLAATLDVKPPSNKMANGEADTPKSEDSNKNKIVTEGIKEENGGPMSVGSDNKKSPAGAGGLGTPGGPGGASSRPESSLPGFIQQQSQIFVFNSEMANMAAESVKQGKHKNIISYHVEQHSSQQAMNQNRMMTDHTTQAQYAQWLMFQRAQNKAGGRTPTYPGFAGKPGMAGMGPGGPEMAGMGCPPNSMGGPGMGSTVEQWVQEQNANLQQQQQAMSGMPAYPITSMGPNGPAPGGSPMYPQGMMGGPGPGPMGGPGGFPMMESAYEFNPDAVGPGGAVSMPHINLSQNKVPNESLTPEQLKNRSEKLRGLSKIKGSLEMRGLLDSGGPPPDMYMGGGQAAMMSQQAMMSQHQALMSGMGPGQGPPHPGMMSPTQQFMMQQQSQHMGLEGAPFPPGHPGFRGSGMGPMDMNARQAWARMQQEYFESKTKMMQHHQQRSQQAAMMGGGGGMGPQHPLSGPPPPYYSTMGGAKRQPGPPMGMVGSPTSPGPPLMDGGVDPALFPAARGHGLPMDPGAMEAMGPAGYGPGPSGMPPHSLGMGMMPGMEGPMMPGMGPQGPMVSGPMMPNRGPGPMMCSTSGVNVVSSTSSRKTAAAAAAAGPPSQVTLHRAGNPEQFTPEPNSASVNSSGSKPPPSYAQAQKRKRDDLEDPFKNLQPTPSPTPLTYLNLSQIEGQELIITKQLNSAFRDSTPAATGPAGGMTPHDPGSAPPHTNQFSSPASNSNPVNSPMPHGGGGGGSNPGGNPPSVKNPLSNSSQTSSTGHLGSPGTLHHAPGQSPLSGANMRLSHFDPAPANGVTGPGSTATSGGSMSSAPATPTAVGPKQPPASQPAGQGSSSSSMSNITSASLANLAKGVENLSNQMQQSMVHGGPFHSIQVQGQVGSTPATNASTSASGGTAACSQPVGAGSTAQPGSSAPGTPKQYINNTNISQVNNYYGLNRDAAPSSMEVHAMGGDGPHVSMTGAGTSNTLTNVTAINGSLGAAAGMPKDAAFRETQLQQQQQQQQAMMMTGGGMGVSMAMSQAQMQSVGPGAPPVNTPMAAMQPGMPPSSSQVKSPPYQSHPHPLPLPSMSTGMQQSVGGGGGAGANRLTSPPFPSNSLGNANVHIQPKAPNTIQYLPANPPPTQPPPNQAPPAMAMAAAGGGAPPPAKRAATEMEMMARYSSPLDMKGAPSSTLQYFPSSPPNHAMRPHPPAAMQGMPEFTPQQTMEMQQAMMMRGGGPGPQDFGPMGPMSQGMHPGMGMGPGGPVPSSMHSPLGLERMDMGGGGMGSPMDPVLMGPGASAMRHATVMGPGGAGSMDPMPSPLMGPSGPYPAGPHPPQGYLANGQSMMMGGQPPMQGPAGHPVSMPSMMPHGGMPRMPGQASSMRMQMTGPPAGSGGYSAQYQQFQQQLYAQGRPRQMSPHMMGAGPPGQPYMGMIPPNMPGAS